MGVVALGERPVVEVGNLEGRKKSLVAGESEHMLVGEYRSAAECSFAVERMLAEA